MGRMNIRVAGRDVLNWTGDEAQVLGLQRTYQEVVAHHNGNADTMAAAAVDDLLRNALARDADIRELHGMAVIYFLLQQDTRTLARPGKIRDYLPVWDFSCDLGRRPDGGISIKIVGTSGAWS